MKFPTRPPKSSSFWDGFHIYGWLGNYCHFPSSQMFLSSRECNMLSLIAIYYSIYSNYFQPPATLSGLTAADVLLSPEPLPRPKFMFQSTRTKKHRQKKLCNSGRKSSYLCLHLVYFLIWFKWLSFKLGRRREGVRVFLLVLTTFMNNLLGLTEENWLNFSHSQILTWRNYGEQKERSLVALLSDGEAQTGYIPM